MSDEDTGTPVRVPGTARLIKRLWAEVREDRPAHDHRHGDDACPRCRMAHDQFADEERAIWADVKTHLRGGPKRPPDDDTWLDRNSGPAWVDDDPIGF